MKRNRIEPSSTTPFHCTNVRKIMIPRELIYQIKPNHFFEVQGVEYKDYSFERLLLTKGIEGAKLRAISMIREKKNTDCLLVKSYFDFLARLI